MKTTAALAAPPSRAPAMPADDSSDGSFAATLDLAREPAKAAPDRSVKTQTASTPLPTPKAPVKPASSASTEPGRKAPAQAEEAAAAAAAADAPLLPDAVLPVLGWPAVALAPDAASTALQAAVPGAQAEAGSGADLDLDVAFALDAAAPDTSVPRAGKARTTLPNPGALMVPPTLASAGALPAQAESRVAPSLASAAAALAAPTLAKSAAEILIPTAPAWSIAAPVATAAAAPTAAAPAAAPAFSAHLAAAIDTPGFAPALATQVSWLVQEGVQLARLTLNPADMGPVAVRIMLEGTQARVDFSAALAGTRAAIEASLPTLAAALHDNGMTLAGGGVSDGQARSGAHGEHGRPLPRHAGAADSADLPDGGRALPARAARGLVDLVA